MTHIHNNTYTVTHMHPYIYLHMHTYVMASLESPTCMHDTHYYTILIHAYSHMCIHTCLHIHIYTFTQMMFLSGNSLTCTYGHKNIHTYATHLILMNTYLYICTHIYSYADTLCALKVFRYLGSKTTCAPHIPHNPWLSGIVLWWRWHPLLKISREGNPCSPHSAN